MKVLVITGDKKFGPGHERYELQRSAVDALEVIYWGRGSLWPSIPAGKFDVVTAQDPFWRGLFGWWVAKRIGAKFNVQVHTDLSVYGGVKHVLMQIVLRHADSVRVVSQKIKSQVEQMGARAKISVLPVFVDISRFRNIVHTPNSQKIILWIGRFEKEKNPEEALTVLRKVQESGIDAGLVMLGAGSQGELLLQSAHQLKHVDFEGWRDPISYFARADVVLCTSVHESWGASIVEALAAGVPVVAPDVGVASEAGANVVERKDLAKEVLRVLRSGQKGTLLLTPLSKDEWAHQWKNTL